MENMVELQVEIQFSRFLECIEDFIGFDLSISWFSNLIVKTGDLGIIGARIGDELWGVISGMILAFNILNKKDTIQTD